MQLLEQLGYSENAVTGSNIVFIVEECAAIQGYMECMSELCESEVLLEGVNVKDTIKKIGNLISEALKRFKEFCKKAAGFFRRKIEELKTKFNRKRNEKKEKSKSEDRETKDVEYPDEDDILEKHRYSGLNPEKIYNASKAVKDVTYRIAQAILNEMSHVTNFEDIATNDKKIIENQTELDAFLNTDTKTILNRIIGESVDDQAGISKFVEKIYTDISRVSIYKNYKLSSDELEDFNDDINLSIELFTNTANLYTNQFSHSLPDLINDLNLSFKKIEIREDVLSEKSVQYVTRVFQKVFSVITLCLNICSSMVSAISKVFDKFKEDAGMICGYIQKVENDMYDYGVYD